MAAAAPAPSAATVPAEQPSAGHAEASRYFYQAPTVLGQPVLNATHGSFLPATASAALFGTAADGAAPDATLLLANHGTHATVYRPAPTSVAADDASLAVPGDDDETPPVVGGQSDDDEDDDGVKALLADSAPFSRGHISVVSLFYACTANGNGPVTHVAPIPTGAATLQATGRAASDSVAPHLLMLYRADVQQADLCTLHLVDDAADAESGHGHAPLPPATRLRCVALATINMADAFYLPAPSGACLLVAHPSRPMAALHTHDAMLRVVDWGRDVAKYVALRTGAAA